MPISSAAYNYLNELHTKEGLIATKNDGSILALNDRAKELLGLSSQDNITNLIFPDSFQFYTQDFRTTDEIEPLTINVNSFEEYINSKKEFLLGTKNSNGSMRWLSTSFKNLKDEFDKHVIISLIDYTTIIEQNQQLIKKNHEQKLLASSLNDLVFEVSKDGEFLNYWTNNPKLLFFQPKDFLSKKIIELFPPNLSNDTLTLIDKAINNKTPQKLIFANPFDKINESWFEMIVKPIKSVHKSQKVLIIISDISDEIKAKKIIKFNEHKFNRAFHYSGIGTSLTNLEGYPINCNKKLCEILGYSKAEFETKLYIDITHPDDKIKDKTARLNLLKGKKNHYTLEKRYLHKNGHYIWCIATISLVRDENNEPSFFIVQIQDITKSKRITEKIEKQNAELEAIKLQLESKIVQLEESNYILAHNLKSPASNIAMLLENIATETNRNIQKDLWLLLEKSSQELSETLNDLNVVLRIKQDPAIKFEHCDLVRITNEILHFYKDDILIKDLEIITDFRVPTIFFAKTYLESILDNLISNAIKFSKRRNNTSSYISIKTYTQQDNTILEVQDNGLGIDLEKFKSQLFMFKKIFHRGFNDKGIGLFMVKYYVETLGGKIDVESAVDKGSTFFIKFIENK